MDVALEGWCSGDCHIRDCRFQSLFSWMLRSKFHYALTSSVNVLFQSLFSWMLRSKCLMDPVPCYGAEVSILVLVDVALEGAVVYSGVRSTPCFNPCSRGCCARRRAGPDTLNLVLGFNPCSRGCCARSTNRLRSNNGGVKFQSLFSWMLRSKPRF